MRQPDAERQENEVLRERIAAILRINASLDLDTVLDEAMECARRLTDARLFEQRSCISLSAKRKPGPHRWAICQDRTFDRECADAWTRENAPRRESFIT